ncbi:BRO-N domain-containing protein [Desulfovibrio oxyclinae]|uniref:BRO-N domain-containing protein n=1 Tax=Desulfovibrio oxyclinae TaxID=63560 RepID=UPI0003729094|nr:BRO family protein [Desulfovibrio oxyclinae]
MNMNNNTRHNNKKIDTFYFNEANRNLRVVVGKDDGEPWFVAKDVCEMLGTETRDIRKVLDVDEVDTIHIGNRGGRQSLIINESGLYSLILRSRKPEAKRFKKWVTSEVLPSIRKNGGYVSPSATPSQLDILEGQLNALRHLEERTREQEQRIEEVEHKFHHNGCEPGYMSVAKAHQKYGFAMVRPIFNKVLEELGVELKPFSYTVPYTDKPCVADSVHVLAG